MLAVGGLAAAIMADRLDFWAIPLVAFVEGVGAALFASAQAGALQAVVRRASCREPRAPRRAGWPRSGWPARRSAARCSGSPALPFLVDAVSYASRPSRCWPCGRPSGRRAEGQFGVAALAARGGFRFLWGHRFLRTCAFLFGLSNFIGVGVLFAVVVLGERQGLSGGRAGVLVSVFGAACCSVRSWPRWSVLSAVRAVLLLELWTWLGFGLFLIWPNVYVLTASTLPTALAIPRSTRSSRLPDGDDTGPAARPGQVHLEDDLAADHAARALVAGVLLDAVAARAAIGLFAAVGLMLAVWGSLSPSIRAAPSLQELDAHG